MGFYDINIPYIESDKPTLVKLSTKAMELGYTGIAYNHTISGVMSDGNRCFISPLPISSLLNYAPSLSSSVTFHRHLVGVPETSRFRQYRRLTVCLDTISQAQTLNGGNAVLKTYDLVAAKPLNQSAFDYVCVKSEASGNILALVFCTIGIKLISCCGFEDIIAIDFSEKLSFRLKLPVVKAAIERGVYFEITYSSIIADAQARKHIIPNAKLLIDWTHGKNLIISSCASSASELRGPYDVANLSSLLGLSVERGKAAISKNCRSVIANALGRKKFDKEAMKVE